MYLNGYTIEHVFLTCQVAFLVSSLGEYERTGAAMAGRVRIPDTNDENTALPGVKYVRKSGIVAMNCYGRGCDAVSRDVTSPAPGPISSASASLMSI